MTSSSVCRATALLCAALFSASAQDALPKGEVLMDKYVEATGGKAAHEKIKTCIMSGTFELAAQGLSAKMTIYRGAPAKSLAQIDVPNMGLIEEGYDGAVAWSKNPMQGGRIKKGAEHDMAAYGATMNPEGQWREVYSDVTTAAAEDVNGTSSYKVDLTLKSGLKASRWFDKKTGLMVKTAMTVESPNGAIPIETFVSDYKSVDGVMMPHKIEQKVMGQEMTLKFDSIKANVTIEDSKFQLPADIKALVGK